jgi:hypothetical protein
VFLIPILALGRVALISLRDQRRDAHRREPRVVLRADQRRNTVMVVEYARDDLTSHVLEGFSPRAGAAYESRNALWAPRRPEMQPATRHQLFAA